MIFNMMKKKKIDSFQSIDELVNYIESDNNSKKKKMKKKNNNINKINELKEFNKENGIKNFGDDFDDDIYEGKDIPDNISVMSGISEADSIVRAFKQDVKSSNYTGEKLKANLSDNFIYNLGE